MSDPVQVSVDKPRGQKMTRRHAKIIAAASVGQVFDAYDIFLYGTLASILAKQFFGNLDPSAGFLFALLAFASGFIVRPLGAIVFGRMGDMVGRKTTFLITLVMMGAATFGIGFLPTYGSIGVAAPTFLIILRLIQGLALGGEYGGAATFLAEHSPPGRRGAYTSCIQATITIGLLLTLLVVLATRQIFGEEAFSSWAWRIPFWVSIVLLAVSMWIRLSLSEAPAFAAMKAEGKTSKAPLSESFGEWRNLKVVVLSLFGLVAGQAVIWYAGQFYVLIFLTQQLKVDSSLATTLVAVALVIGTPLFVLFGVLSDKIGRKPVILGGCLLAAITFFPTFHALAQAANPQLTAAQAATKVTVTADPASCSFLGNPVAREIDFSSSCDIARRHLTQNSVNYENVPGPPGSTAIVRIGDETIEAPSGNVVDLRFDDRSTRDIAAFNRAVTDKIRAAGYPTDADPARINFVAVVALLVWLVLLGAMVYGPIGAAMVELFPMRVRYTSMSLPYHVGNGWFGGLLPAIVFTIAAASGNMFSGLWYPVIIAAVTLIIGVLFIPETKDTDIHADYESAGSTRKSSGRG